ncbi:MAG: hypothetical protein HGA33_06495 [Candidatus Moranbacteria bacterium]|nr:hypothetical protein [Candidatus Moranbacteria bacterium]
MNLIRATEDDMPVLTAIEETARDLIVYNWGFTDEGCGSGSATRPSIS